LLPQRSMKIPPYPPLVKGGWGDFHINRIKRLAEYRKSVLACQRFFKAILQ
jgi:hypothetical protein